MDLIISLCLWDSCCCYVLFIFEEIVFQKSEQLGVERVERRCAFFDRFFDRWLSILYTTTRQQEGMMFTCVQTTHVKMVQDNSNIN